MADVSGANFNPAVSVGLLVGKRISIERFFIYVVAQVCYVTVTVSFLPLTNLEVCIDPILPWQSHFDQVLPDLRNRPGSDGDTLTSIMRLQTV